MDKWSLADYAYHNCEFQLAVSLALKSTSPNPVVGVKSLCELDQAEQAVALSEKNCQTADDRGRLFYYLGMSYYLAGKPRHKIQAAFSEARQRGCTSAHMGLAFLAFAKGKLRTARKRIAFAHTTDDELEHVRLLMAAQIEIGGQNYQAARLHLNQSDQILARRPSLLRHRWGQVMWIRYYRCTGQFRTAQQLLERLTTQVGNHPRLLRNTRDAQTEIENESVEHNTIFPADSDLTAKISTLSRRPMLNSLFKYLQSSGRTGASKEDIVQEVWDESYNPLIHDDRIYKAVGRLRKILGDNCDVPHLIYQKGRQYFVNDRLFCPQAKDEHHAKTL